MSKHPLYNTTGLQKNNKSHVLYALTDKQIQLQKLQEEYNIKIAKLKSDLSALETTICLFNDDCRETLKKIRDKGRKSTSKRIRRFGRGELSKLILTQLRSSSEPLTTDEVYEKIQSVTNYDFAFKTNVKDGLKALVNKGVVELAPSVGRTNAYKIREKD